VRELRPLSLRLNARPLQGRGCGRSTGAADIARAQTGALHAASMRPASGFGSVCLCVSLRGVIHAPATASDSCFRPPSQHGARCGGPERAAGKRGAADCCVAAISNPARDAPVRARPGGVKIPYSSLVSHVN